MNTRDISRAVEFSEDRALDAAERAGRIFDAAQYEARHSVTRAEVLERVTETFRKNDDRKFEEALRDGDIQAVTLSWARLSETFEALASEKTRAILEAKPCDPT
jgi:ribosome biogenesis protein Tsr3